MLGALVYPALLAGCGVFHVRDVRALLHADRAPVDPVDIDLVAEGA
jgi:hypothetical protein